MSNKLYFALPDSNGVVHQCNLITTSNGLAKFVDQQGRVAVMYSPGYGNNWMTSAMDETNMRTLCTDSRLIGYRFLGHQSEFAYEHFFVHILGAENTPDEAGYETTVLDFVQGGCLFQIREYDGSEWVEVFDESKYLSA